MIIWGLDPEHLSSLKPDNVIKGFWAATEVYTPFVSFQSLILSRDSAKVWLTVSKPETATAAKIISLIKLIIQDFFFQIMLKLKSWRVDSLFITIGCHEASRRGARPVPTGADSLHKKATTFRDRG
jgi:hypothetical protein